MSPPTAENLECQQEYPCLAKKHTVIKEATKLPPQLEDVLDMAGAGEAGLWMIEKLMQVAKLTGAEDKPETTKCAILPCESKAKLVLSDISLKLDRVRRFLEHDIGYVLLDDAASASGGAVKLETKRRSRKQKGPGHVAPSTQVKEDTEIVRFSPDMARFARYPDDLVLVWRFVNTLDGVGHQAVGETLCKTMLQGVRLMHSCKYGYTDIVLTLAYTSVYFKDTVAHINQNMCDYEAAHVCALLMYLAHSFILDQTCPLKFWQQHIFKHYCSLKILDTALFRLFRLLGFKLRISAEDEQRALSIMLRDAASKEDADLILQQPART